jgi:hypothetical protein
MACFTASAVDAAPAPQVFALTISVTALADFDHTTAPIQKLDCETSSRAKGLRTVTFRSSRPTLVRFVGGRLRPVVAGDLTGSVMLSGTNTSNRVCGGEVTHTPQSCAKTTRIFKTGRVAFSSVAAGSITVRPPRVALIRGECPEEPDDVVALPLGPAPGPLHISPATLTSSRFSRLTLTASARRTKHYGSPEAGTVEQHTAWKLTLVRRRG